MSALAARWLARPDSRVDGADRQRRAERVPGDRLPPHARHPTSCACSTSIRAATAKLERNLRALPNLADLRVVRAALDGRGVQRRRHRHDRDRRQAQRRDPTPQMIEPGMHINAVGGDCPGKTELHARHPAQCPDARVVVEFEPQSRIEGEIQQLPSRLSGHRIRRVLTGEAAGRTSAAATSRSSIRSASRSRTSRRCASCTRLHQRGARRASAQIDLVPDARGSEGPVRRSWLAGSAASRPCGDG